MSEEDVHILIAEILGAVLSAETMAIGLRNIAGGHWNVGREVDITPLEYAADILRRAGLSEWS